MQVKMTFRGKGGRFERRDGRKAQRLEVYWEGKRVAALPAKHWTKAKAERASKKVERAATKKKREVTREEALRTFTEAVLAEAEGQLSRNLPRTAEIEYQEDSIVKVSIKPGGTPPGRKGRLIGTTWFLYDVAKQKTVGGEHGRREHGKHK